MTSGSLSPRRKSLSTPHTTWMSATLPRAGSAPPARSSLRFHSRTSCSAPGTRYSPVWGAGRGSQPHGDHSIAAPTAPDLPPSSLASPPQSHTAPPARAPAAAWRGRSQPARPGEDNADLLCDHCPAPRRAKPQHPRADIPAAPQGRGAAPQAPPCPPPHLAGPGMVARPGRTGAGALLLALGVQQQLALAALDGSLPKADAGAADTARLGADHLERGSRVRALFLQVSSTTPSSPLQNSPHHLHPSPVQAELGWGGTELCPPSQTHSSCPAPFSIVAKRRERGWGMHRFGGELVLERREAPWKRGEGG